MKKTKSMNFLFLLLGVLLVAIIPHMAVPPALNADVEPETVILQDGLDGYSGTRDTYIWDDEPGTSHGGETTIVQDINTSDERRSLLLFDLSSIPSGSIILSSELQFYVDVEGQGFNMHRMLVSWDEAATYNSIGGKHFKADDIDAESSVNANWPGVDGHTGFITVSVPASTIQDWVEGTLANNGWLMIATHESDGQQLRSREYATAGDRPKLTVTYLPSSGHPTIAVTNIPLSSFSSAIGTPSAEQSYTVAGINLSENIVITAPADFEISTTSGSGFSSSLTLYQSGGSVAATTIYVRFNRSTQGTSSGNITHASTGATTKNVAVSGTAGNIPITVTFRQGENGYSGTIDTFIMESNADEARGDEDWIEWDTDDPQGEGKWNFGLILFGDIFGSNANQIPLGATIESATLTYVVSDTGDSADVNEVAIDWTEDVTYNGFGGVSGVQTDDYGAPADIAGGAATGTHTINVTASLIVWAGDPSANHGWIFRPTDSNGVEFRSSEYGTVSDRPLLTVTYSTGGPANQAPDQPTLVRPSDEAPDVSFPPTLEVTVSDPDANTMEVIFYGREVGTTSPGADFTIIALPDTQNEAQYYPSVFDSQTQWIVDNKTEHNIVFVTHLGDIVNDADNATQWDNADHSMDILDAGNVAYSVGPGNHDLPLYTSSSLYPTYFGTSRFAGKSYYGGYRTSDNYNNYSLFSASGMDFILINLQYEPTTAMLDWADALLKANTNRRGIVVSHSILNLNNSFNSAGTAIFNALKDNPNIFLMLCGHMHGTTDGAAYREELADDGHTIINIMLADYQDYPNGGNGYMRLLRFSPADNTIYVTTYSPYAEQQYITSYPDQMEIEYDMTDSAPFDLIGSVNDVADGSNASISWPDRLPETEYEWKVVVSDGISTTEGPIWSFTTGTGLTGDLDHDCDVDGSDLLLLIAAPESMELGVFAGVFGSVCP